MKKIFVALCCAGLLFVNSTVRADDGGALLGGLVGGVLCSNFGQGNGRAAAIGTCAAIGAITGDRMSRQPAPYYYPSSSTATQRPPYSAERSYGYDSEIEAAHASGRADREREQKQRAIQDAYRCGRDGTC